MSEMNEEHIDSQRVIDELTKRGATQPCARCGGKQFTVAQDFVNLVMQQSTDSIVIGGPTIPAAVAVCTHCGAITLHALGVLGLMPQQGATGQPADAKTEAK